MIETARTAVIATLVGVLVAGCSTAAQLGDSALNRGSFGRIQATPFTDIIETQACQDSLTRAVGFTHQTQSVTNGVHVSSAFRCDAERVIASVNLKNLTNTPMRCFARTETNETGVEVGPYGIAQFEYNFSQSMSQTCEVIASP